ncbi:hypothetical protein F5Y09DRAFT_104450 [Xylaria sp. FL1042]|nr:hypothetical protein F5Y09DRAFT_104450 [Xylaria sp. FL1042]
MHLGRTHEKILINFITTTESLCSRQLSQLAIDSASFSATGSAHAMRCSKPVCLLCRLQVTQATSKTHAVPWQTQTVRLSTTPSSRRDIAGAGGTAPNETVVSEQTSNPSQSQSPAYLHRVASPKHRPSLNPSKLQVPASRTRITGNQPSSRADVLFQQIVQGQNGPRDAAGYVSPGAGSMVDLGLVKAIGKLQEMIDQDTPVADAYRYYRTEITPAVQAPGTYVPQAYHKVKLSLLEKLVVAKKADMFAEELPTVADIFRAYVELDELKPKKWAILVGELIQCIVNMDPSTGTQTIAEYERQFALRKAMLADLIESWKLLSLPRNAISPTSEDQLTKDFWFPRLGRFTLGKFARTGNFTAAFSTLLPHYPRSHIGTPVAVLAIATYALMHDSQRCSVEIRQNATRFMSKVASLVIFVDYRDEDLRKDLVNTFPDLEEYVMGLWPKIKVYLEQKPVSLDAGTTEVYRIPISTKDNQAPLAFNATLIGNRLSRSFGSGNVKELDRLWEEFVGSQATISQERAAQIRQHPHLIDSFIKIRMALNQPEKAVVAWNILGKVGLKPSIRTWNLMLQGLRRTRNLDGIKNIWAKLARSGLKLDTQIWTTRVAGLIDCGDVDGGLRALEEMAKLWEKDRSKATAVAPTIEPVNAALAGLIRLKKHDVAEKLLAWAGRKGIQPDVFTFNTMLRQMIRDGNRNEDVEKLFAAMQAQGVRADEATFTIVLDASFSQDNTRDPEEQANIVADVASAMSAAGLELNMQTYGKMIYLLLCSNATTAAMAVVNHLYNRNLELSPHIYTMLVEHCFQQNPPALDSVHLFVQRRRHLDFDDMDYIFYDRVVKNYVLVGETKAAFDIYKHVVGAGSSVSLETLNHLLQALHLQERFEDARYLVNSEKRYERRNPDPREQYWSNQFWQLASDYKLLDSPPPGPVLMKKSN